VLIVSSNDLPGYRIDAVLGEVFGVTVRAQTLGAGMTAGLRALGGGEVPEMTQLMVQSHRRVPVRQRPDRRGVE
jgi:uncharacterized protein YbjQ (UPF0145 family)